MSRRQPRPEVAVAACWRVLLCAPTPPGPRAAALAAALRGVGAEVEIALAPGLETADFVIWTEPATRRGPMPPGAINVIDLHGASGTEVLEQCRGAALLLAGSETEFGAWSAALERARIEVPIAVVPFAAPLRPRTEPAGFGALRIVGGPEPSAATLDLIGRAAAWAAARGIACGMDDAAGPAGLAAVALAGPPLADATAGDVVLDARPSGQVLAPDALITALAAGAPVLCCAETPLLHRIEAAGAGMAVPALEADLDAFAALPPARLQGFSDAASALAGTAFDPAQAVAALQAALRRAEERRRRRDAAWLTSKPGLGPGGHVLAVSDEALNLVDIRVHLPLAVLHRRGLIDGYSILRHGEIAFSTDPDAPVDMLWVHRSVDSGVQLLMRALGQPFVYDVDDNLLVSPSYRNAFPPETIEAAQGLLRACTVLSCATPGLFDLLQHHSGLRLAGKAVITPNLAASSPAAVSPGPTRAVVWASSDKPALTASRAEVERAVRDFCAARSLRIVCLGAKPPPILAESGLEIEHVGLISYTAYLARLRGLAPGILVCPLETEADLQTQGFVNGKSDVKAIEARQTGLVGVFSRARPYVESDLGPEILCDNTYESWLDGLERAAALCRAPRPAAPWPPQRDADALGPLPWTEALSRVRMATPLDRSTVLDAVRFVREQRQTVLTSRESFDEAYYLGRHEDVRLAIERGIVSSGYDHYRTSGIREARAARRRPTAEAAADAWWTGLLQTVSRVEADVEARGRALDALRARLRLRRVRTGTVASEPAVVAAPTTAEPAHPSLDLHWHPPGATVEQPCPVCDTPGPHPVLLRADGHTLVRCRSCASCFYEDRVFYDYERDQDADILLQSYLEQNASIHHQTRFLFSFEGVGSVLDVGCGFGYPVDVASKVLGWRATGIDPAMSAGTGAALLQADIRKEYLTEDTDLGAPFDLVVASEVIEHMPDPYAFLGLLRRWMERDGTLVLTTPNAAALTPGIGPGSLVGILALNVHLMLFNKESLGMALRRAGFRHVQVEAEQDGLIAYASDQPLRFRADAAERHIQTYKRYLEYLVESAEPGSGLWNGAAGRLLVLLQDSADLPTLHALYARVAAAWRERFGIDLARLRLPALLPETAFSGPDRVRSAAFGAGQPINLAGVLYVRAVMERRAPGRTPEQVLAYARPAYLHAVQTRRVLQGDDIIDLDLKRTAWRARMLVIDCLAELAPEVEPELLLALAADSPGDLHDRIDPPVEAMVERIVPSFTRLVHADRFDEATRLAPWTADLDAVCAATAGDPERRFRALFTVGVLRLVHGKDPVAALEAFERMEAEARTMLDDPAGGETARHFLVVATEHVRLAASRLEPAA